MACVANGLALCYIATVRIQLSSFCVCGSLAVVIGTLPVQTVLISTGVVLLLDQQGAPYG